MRRAGNAEIDKLPSCARVLELDLLLVSGGGLVHPVDVPTRKGNCRPRRGLTIGGSVEIEFDDIVEGFFDIFRRERAIKVIGRRPPLRLVGKVYTTNDANSRISRNEITKAVRIGPHPDSGMITRKLSFDRLVQSLNFSLSILKISARPWFSSSS